MIKFNDESNFLDTINNLIFYLYPMSTSVIITAGGIGKRMGKKLPKQFIQLNEKPILMYTLERFYHFDPQMQLILTLPLEWKSYWDDLVDEYDFAIPHRVVSGGSERYHSIKNALAYCTGDIIAIHDGVRPLVSEDTLDSCFRLVEKLKAVIPVVPITESLRKRSIDGSTPVNRTEYILVQTPQVFTREIITNAYNRTYHAGITDDASLVEESGIKVFTVPGNEENIKITTQTDLAIAEFLLK